MKITIKFLILLLTFNAIQSSPIQKRLFGSITNAISSVTNVVTSGVSSVVSTVGSVATGAIGLITDGINLAVDGITSLGSSAVSLTSSALNQAVSTVNDLAQTSLNNLPGGVVNNLISNIINEASNGVHSVVNGVNSASQSILNSASSSFTEMVSLVDKVGQTAVNQAIAAVNQGVNEINSLAQNVVSESFNALNQCVNGIADLASNAVEKYLHAVNQVVSQMSDIAMGVVNEVINTATQLITVVQTFMEIGGQKCMFLLLHPTKDDINKCLNALDSVVGVSACASAFLDFSSDSFKKCGALVANIVSPGSGAVILLLADCAKANSQDKLKECAKKAATMLFTNGLSLPAGIQNLIGDATGAINGIISEINNHIGQVTEFAQNIVNQVTNSIPIDFIQNLNHDLVNLLPQNIVNNLAQNVITNLDFANGILDPSIMNNFISGTLGSVQSMTSGALENIMQSVLIDNQILSNLLPVNELHLLTTNLSNQMGQVTDLAHNAAMNLFAENIIENMPINAIQNFVDSFVNELQTRAQLV